MCGVQFTIVRPGGLTVDPPTGEINVIKGEVRCTGRLYLGMPVACPLVERIETKSTSGEGCILSQRFQSCTFFCTRAGKCSSRRDLPVAVVESLPSFMLPLDMPRRYR